MTKRNNIKLETVNIYAETGDFVFCTYCGKKMLLPRGQISVQNVKKSVTCRGLMVSQRRLIV